jgi:uncharacterized protein YjbI with pentapeptide repeats
MLAMLKRAFSAIAKHWKVLALILGAILLALVITAWRLPSPLRKFLKWPFPTHPVTGVLLVATSVFLILLLWLFPKWQVRSVAGLEPKDRFDRENEARKTLSQILGGLVLLIGFYFTWQNLGTTQENLRIAAEGQITDRFTKAIAQLGDTKLELRLGGIYALERIANDSPKDHWPVMEVLTSYVREHAGISNAGKPLPKTSADKSKEAPPKPAADIQSILTVIGRRNVAFEDLDIQHLNLRKTDLRGADLRGADLRGADLRGADLRGARLNGTDLSGTDLSEAYLFGAYLNNADLSGAILSNAFLNMAQLHLAHLGEADLRGAYFLKADLTYATLSGADLSGANLLKADLSNAFLDKAIFFGAGLKGANLRGTDLSGAYRLSPEQIESANGDSETTLPDGIARPKFWH